MADHPYKPRGKAGLRLGSILRARCPACDVGSVLGGIFAIAPRCPYCDLDLHPEPGFYLGAMFVSYLTTAALTIPPTIFLKVIGVDIYWVVMFPFFEFLFLGTFLAFYCRILWLHLEYRMTERLDGDKSGRTSRR